MKFKPGKLYTCPKFFLMVYPSKEKASSAKPSSIAAAEDDQTLVAYQVNYLSTLLNCQVRCSDIGEIFMFLERDDHYLRVLFGEKQGWIIFRDWLGIEDCAATAQSLEVLNEI